MKAIRRYVETPNSRIAIRSHRDEDGYQIWLGLDHDSYYEFIVGLGQTRVEALADARLLLSRCCMALAGLIADEHTRSLNA